jgi:hypothetical protein
LAFGVYSYKLKLFQYFSIHYNHNLQSEWRQKEDVDQYLGVAVRIKSEVRNMVLSNRKDKTNLFKWSHFLLLITFNGIFCPPESIMKAVVPLIC